MTVAVASECAIIATKATKAELETAKNPQPSVSSLGVAVTRLPTEDDVDALATTESRTTLHIYHEKECHKCISPVADPTRDRRSGPTLKETKLKRIEKKEREKSGRPLVEPDDNAFFLHSPYLAFHMPPRVLYVGSSKHAVPAVLIHEGCAWTKYKLQVGPSIAKPGVIDPRGVVSWKHNGGNKKALKQDDRRLKGYKVRTWRLWGETGKKYVHSVKEIRKAGTGSDPDILQADGLEATSPVEADEVVYLRWTNPFSRHTRRYHFKYANIDFFWKGTGTVRESRTCGFFLRFNHLKLVAKLPNNGNTKDEERPEFCLGKYTSSIASKKSGTLDFFDTSILRLIEEYDPNLINQNPFEDQPDAQEEDEASKISRMKKSPLYQIIVATGMCMIISEKEKRQTLLEFLAEGGEAGGGGG